jgi:hypothetical protein
MQEANGRGSWDKAKERMVKCNGGDGSVDGYYKRTYYGRARLRGRGNERRARWVTDHNKLTERGVPTAVLQY